MIYSTWAMQTHEADRITYSHVHIFHSTMVIPYQCQFVQRRQHQAHFGPSQGLQTSRPTSAIQGHYLQQKNKSCANTTTTA